MNGLPWTFTPNHFALALDNGAKTVELLLGMENKNGGLIKDENTKIFPNFLQINQGWLWPYELCSHAFAGWYWPGWHAFAECSQHFQKNEANSRNQRNLSPIRLAEQRVALPPRGRDLNPKHITINYWFKYSNWFLLDNRCCRHEFDTGLEEDIW